MLFLLLQIGDGSYALAASRIVEVLPLVAIKPVRGAPPEIAGSVRYRGEFLPVVDLEQLELGRPASARMGTRLVVVEVGTGEQGGLPARLGIIAASATETLRCEPAAFTPFAPSPRGLVQRLDIDGLLPARLRDVLFNAAADAA